MASGAKTSSNTTLPDERWAAPTTPGTMPDCTFTESRGSTRTASCTGARQHASRVIATARTMRAYVGLWRSIVRFKVSSLAGILEQVVRVDAVQQLRHQRFARDLRIAAAYLLKR